MASWVRFDQVRVVSSIISNNPFDHIFKVSVKYIKFWLVIYICFNQVARSYKVIVNCVTLLGHYRSWPVGSDLTRWGSVLQLYQTTLLIISLKFQLNMSNFDWVIIICFNWVVRSYKVSKIGYLLIRWKNVSLILLYEPFDHILKVLVQYLKFWLIYMYLF